MAPAPIERVKINLKEVWRQSHVGLRLLDREAEEKGRTFRQAFGAGEYDIFPVEGDLHDPDLWTRVLGDIDETHAKEEKKYEPIVLVCTDNDVSNLSLALTIRRLYFKDALIHCRLFGEVSFEKEMTKGHNIETYRIDELLRRNLPPEVLGRRK